MVTDGRQEAQVPPLVELFCDTPDGWALAYIGVNVKHGKGFMTYSNPAGSVTSFNGNADRSAVEYSYMGIFVRSPPTPRWRGPTPPSRAGPLSPDQETSFVKRDASRLPPLTRTTVRPRGSSEAWLR